MEYELYYLDLRELFEFLIGGFSCHHYYNGTEGELFGRESINDNRFQEAHFITLELYTPEYINFKRLLGYIENKPSFAFTKIAEKTNLNRYCFIYLFNKPIRTIELYNRLSDAIQLELESDCGSILSIDKYSVNDALWGNTESRPERKSTTNVFEFTDFIEIPSIPSSEPIIDGPVDADPAQDQFTDDEFKTDFFNIRDLTSYQLFELKYKDKYKFFDRSELPIVDSTEMYIELPEDYIEIVRQHGRVKDKKGGDRRLKLLKANALIRRKIKPDISFQHLLYCLAIERQYHFDNSDGLLKNNLLVQICEDAMSVETIKIRTTNKKRECMVNPKFCEENFVSKRAVAGHRKAYLIRRYLDTNYNPKLTPKQNIKVFESSGFKVSSSTVYKYCAENDIQTKPHKVIS